MHRHIIGGAKWAYREAETKSFTRAGWILMAIAAIAGTAGYYRFDRQFTAVDVRTRYYMRWAC
jgi:hypothetical protein